MKNIFKSQMGFIHIPVLIAIAIVIGVVIVGSGAGFSFVEYKQISEKITKAQQLLAAENYEEATTVLNDAQASWFVGSVGFKGAQIQSELQKIETRKIHKGIYDKGLIAFDKAIWEEAIANFSEIPEGSFYYHQSQTKIEEAKRKVVEEELKEERTAREVAEGKASIEEAARKKAEQRTVSEQLAKERQQRETEVQSQRADQEEKAKILELANTQPPIKAIVNGELKFYIYPLSSYAAIGVSTAVEDIATTLSSWNPYGATIRRVYNSNDADITISWIRDYGSEILGQAIFRAHLEVGLGKNNCIGEWSAFDGDTVKKILWHELGHSMGYGHSTNPSNIMYSETSTQFDIDQTISEVIAGGYFLAIPLCGSGTYSYSFQAGGTPFGFDLFVLPPNQDAKEFSGGGGRHYPSCSVQGSTIYTGSCTVPSGAQIYIGNTSFYNAVPISGKIIDMDQSPWPDMTWDENAFQYDNNELENYRKLFH